jgi:hypothetical protein
MKPDSAEFTGGFHYLVENFAFYKSNAESSYHVSYDNALGFTSWAAGGGGSRAVTAFYQAGVTPGTPEEAYRFTAVISPDFTELADTLGFGFFIKSYEEDGLKNTGQAHAGVSGIHVLCRAHRSGAFGSGEIFLGSYDFWGDLVNYHYAVDFAPLTDLPIGSELVTVEVVLVVRDGGLIDLWVGDTQVLNDFNPGAWYPDEKYGMFVSSQSASADFNEGLLSMTFEWNGGPPKPPPEKTGTIRATVTDADGNTVTVDLPVTITG